MSTLCPRPLIRPVSNHTSNLRFHPRKIPLRQMQSIDFCKAPRPSATSAGEPHVVHRKNVAMRASWQDASIRLCANGKRPCTDLRGSVRPRQCVFGKFAGFLERFGSRHTWRYIYKDTRVAAATGDQLRRCEVLRPPLETNPVWITVVRFSVRNFLELVKAESRPRLSHGVFTVKYEVCVRGVFSMRRSFSTHHVPIFRG